MPPCTSSRYRGAPSPSRRIRRTRKCYIETLAVEVMSKIFHQVHLMSIENPVSSDERDSVSEPGGQDNALVTEWTNEDANISQLFPYSQASVCIRWKAILARELEYWTRVIVNVGPNPTPLKEVEDMLKRSKELPIEFYVGREEEDYPADDPTEPSWTREVTALLIPHVHRCTKISYDVVLSSSLPSVMWDLKSASSLLCNLILKCERDDGGNPRNRKRREDSCEPDSVILTPKLRFLSLDGSNFATFGPYLRNWIRIPSRAGNDLSAASVRISHYSPHTAAKGPTFDIGDAIAALVFPMSSLHFHDLHFPEIPDKEYDNCSFFLKIQSLVLTEMPNSFIVEFLRIAFISRYDKSGSPEYLNVRIEHCDISGVELPSCNLSLINIPHIAEFRKLLVFWLGGKSLHVENVPDFTDDVLQVLTPQKDYGYPCHPRMLNDLFLQGCPGITIWAMMWFIERRIEATEDNDDVNGDIQQLTVLNCWPHMKQKDELWFKAKVRSADFK